MAGDHSRVSTPGRVFSPIIGDTVSSARGGADAAFITEDAIFTASNVAGWEHIQSIQCPGPAAFSFDSNADGVLPVQRSSRAFIDSATSRAAL